MDSINRTQFAMAAFDFANIFNSAFSTTPIEGHALQLTSPEGQSTGGGIQNLQHMVLINIAEKVNLVIGSVNKGESVAEVRSFTYIEQLYEQRFPNRIFDVQREAYDELLNRITNFLKSQSFELTVVEELPKKVKPENPSVSTSEKSLVPMLCIGAVALGIVGIIIYYFTFLS